MTGHMCQPCAAQAERQRIADFLDATARAWAGASTDMARGWAAAAQLVRANSPAIDAVTAEFRAAK